MAMAMLSPLIPIIPPILIAVVVIALFGEILYHMVVKMPELLKIIKSITDPEVFLRDLSFGIMKGIQLIMLSIVDLIRGIVRMVFKKLHISDDILGNRNSDSGKSHSKIKCVKPTFFKYIILVLCPPLYIFMNKGINGWIYILFDILFTCMFYFPGLIYAMIICENC